MVARRRAVRSTVRRKATVRRRPRRKAIKIKVNKKIAREIWGVIFFTLGILTILSFQGAFGVLGELLIVLLKPIVGIGIYLIPGVFILISIMLFFSKKVSFGASRTLGVFLLLISVLSIIHLSVPLDQIYEYASKGRYGGYVGFVTNFLFLEVLGVGVIGSAVIFVATFLVSLLLLFEISLRDLASLFVPNVRFELTGSDSFKKTKKLKSDILEEIESSKPEIMIHRPQVKKNKDAVRVGDVIYDDGEDVVKVDKGKKVVVNKGEEKAVSESLDSGLNKKKVGDGQEWKFPSLDLLKVGDSTVKVDEELLMENADLIKQKLRQFGVDVVIHEVNVGPTVIQYTLKPDEGVKLSKITSLKNDLALALAAERVRIEAPIPGKSLVGIEVPNKYRAIVYLREILESAAFTDAKSKLILPLGRDVSGKPIIANLETMPHLLIAGATGSGKSVAMNTFLISLLYQNTPDELKFIMIDPKRVELSSYNSIPHLLTPVITDPEKAAISLRWVVSEMSRRYHELSEKRVRNIFEYNDLSGVSKLARIVVVIDELADLMMVAGKEVEASIARIAQMARAVGIHLMIATQRPSVDVITGLIKANIPSRIAFAVSSSIDSRTILDGSGAEDLVGRGDMLYLPTGKNKPVRVQGIFVSTDEIERVTNRVKLTIEPDYDDSITSTSTAQQTLVGVPDSKAGNGDDSMYEAAYNLVVETGKASASLLQRRLKVGYARAARLIDLLEENGVVSSADGAKPRKILI